MQLLTSLFLTLLALEVMTRLWLARRQMQHVKQHREQVPAEFSARIRLRSHQRAADYTVDRTRLGMVETVFDAAVLLALTLGGGLHWIASSLESLLGSGMTADIALVGAILLLIAVLHLPFTLYRQFGLEARYGFNRMTLKLFITDSIKGLLVALALGTPVVALILWLMQVAGQSWWFWAWFVWAGFNLVMMLIFPTWIAPLFNKFTALEDDDLRGRIEALARRCGFSINGLFVMDGSRRSAHGNAYFTGFGRSRRIVFFDTLLSKLTADEIEAVLAHELGHFKHRHITKRITMSLLTALMMFALLGWLGMQAWFYTDLGVAAPDTSIVGATGLILFFMVVPVFTFWFTPLLNMLSRKDEFEADRFAAHQSDPEQLVSALVKLFDDNAATLTPDPVHSAFYDTHPPAAIRIRQLTAPT
ncbi:M48 family metallopeptidase [Orrella marina]|uniref:Peptidase M48 n=1 Tax=Orrella marina TaxID=2163011 RepID=A0A2R4XIE2_9BURK|nr:M48 family metallopeptidase [Orrella marina]AWB33565.1 peptidase M48 [Orrella marina]